MHKIPFSLVVDHVLGIITLHLQQSLCHGIKLDSIQQIHRDCSHVLNVIYVFFGALNVAYGTTVSSDPA
jgi:hypothetical protein